MPGRLENITVSSITRQVKRQLNEYYLYRIFNDVFEKLGKCKLVTYHLVCIINFYVTTYRKLENSTEICVYYQVYVTNLSLFRTIIAKIFDD